jgi:FkbM family methyltransferase
MNGLDINKFFSGAKKTIRFIWENPTSVHLILALMIPYIINRIKERVCKERLTELHEFLFKILHLKYHLPLQLIYALETKIFRNPHLHEYRVSEYLLKTKGKLFIDLGANLGRYSILLAGNYEKVIAVEPDPNNMHFLKRNVEAAGVQNVEFMQVAVGNREGEVKLYMAPHIGGHNIYVDNGLGYTTVQMKMLASILAECRADLVKVDVEGAEWEVLEGALPVMDKIDSWVIELHNVERKKEMQILLEKFGYRCLWLDDKHVYASRRLAV